MKFSIFCINFKVRSEYLFLAPMMYFRRRIKKVEKYKLNPDNIGQNSEQVSMKNKI